MTIKFHRLVVPTYPGGLPSTHDYVNNALTGTPAPADGAKVGGTNAGTYFDAFGEDATSSNANRGNKALSQNTDYLDDLLNTSVAAPAEIVATAGSNLAYVEITGDVFVGKSGTVNTQDERNQLILVLNQDTGQVVTNVNGLQVRAATISASGGGASIVGTELTGFRTNVRVTFTYAIPSGTDYRLVYLKRSSLVNIVLTDFDGFNRGLLRGAESISFGGIANWADGTPNAACSVNYALQKIISDLISTSGQTGAGKLYKGISPPWHNSATIPASQMNTWLNAIVSGLAGTVAGASGAEMVGTALHAASFTDAPYDLDADDIFGHIAALLGWINELHRQRTITGSQTVDNGGFKDSTIFLNPSANFTLTMVNPAGVNKGRRILLQDVSGDMSNPAKSVAVARYTGTNINGSANDYTLSADYGQWWLVSDGVGWYIA